MNKLLYVSLFERDCSNNFNKLLNISIFARDCSNELLDISLFERDCSKSCKTFRYLNVVVLIG